MESCRRGVKLKVAFFHFLYSPIWQIIQMNNQYDIEIVNFKAMYYIVPTLSVKVLEQKTNNLDHMY